MRAHDEQLAEQLAEKGWEIVEEKELEDERVELTIRKEDLERKVQGSNRHNAVAAAIMMANAS